MSPKMSSQTSADPHAVFRDWAISKGVTIHSDLAVEGIPGKGIGVLAINKIPVSRVILVLQTSCIHASKSTTGQ
jgi:hypothetical protein